ncbi:MAG TPA: methyltransferase [Gemmatimonadales bacterium]|nr:methyltransferase [Gemmatimonadales bacterium]
MRLASILGYAAAVLAVLGLWRGHALLAHGWLGLTVQGLAIALMIWARWTFGRRSFYPAADPKAGALVTGGPYRYLRHPIYAAILYFTWAAALSHAGAVTLALALLATLGLGVRIWAEEQLLRARFPEYGAYAAETSRVVPGLV